MRSTLFRAGAGLAALLLALTSLSGTVSAQNGVPSALAGVKPAPPGPLPQLPYDGYPSPRPMAIVRAVYEFAARHPEVLNYMPCFCGCDRSAGHKANHDCFVRKRGADGRIVEWDSHGLGCAICVDVARDSMQMYNSGASVSQIRAAIDGKYASAGNSTMKTPKPVAAAKK